MTSTTLADMLNARRGGPGRWQARCPAHRDRSPSLSIAEGDDGRTLLLCRAGCATEAVVTAMGLSMRDLFAGPSSPAKPNRLRQNEHGAQRHTSWLECDRVWKLAAIVDALGDRLRRLPRGDPKPHEAGRPFDVTLQRVPQP